MGFDLKQSEEILTALASKRHLVYLGAAALGLESYHPYFHKWLQRGMHAQMEYLAKHDDVRTDSTRIMPGAKTALLFAMPYYFEDESSPTGGPQIALYARLTDYHRLLRDALQEICRAAPDLCGELQHEAWIFTDTPPLFERALAARTGRGHIGHNSCFMLPETGSYILLGEIITSRDVPTTTGAPAQGAPSCEGCGLCRRHCPTGALETPFTVDARRCLAYWTIEHRGTVPAAQWSPFSAYYFGCDICQIVCPYNHKVILRAEDRWVKIKTIPPLEQMATMDQRGYEDLCGGTPLTRAKLHGLKRNALIAMHVTNHPLISVALAAIGDDAHPVLIQTKQQILQAASERCKKG